MKNLKGLKRRIVRGTRRDEPGTRKQRKCPMLKQALQSGCTGDKKSITERDPTKALRT